MKNSLENSPRKESDRSVLSTEDQEIFESLVKVKAEELIKEKARKYVGKTRFSKGPDLYGYQPYEQPKIIDLIANNKGYASFIIKETIDYGSPVDIATPQERFEVYIIKHGDKNPVHIFEDHAYVVPPEHPAYSRISKDDRYYGNPAITNLVLRDNVVEYSSRDGNSAYEIN
ncbi:MAG: hypothetical protein R3B39_02810 [Candidatus Paceibacterota bacterium]